MVLGERLGDRGPVLALAEEPVAEDDAATRTRRGRRVQAGQHHSVHALGREVAVAQHDGVRRAVRRAGLLEVRRRGTRSSAPGRRSRDVGAALVVAPALLGDREVVADPVPSKPARFFWPAGQAVRGARPGPAAARTRSASRRLSSPWLRVNESRLSNSTASNPSSAQPRRPAADDPRQRCRFPGSGCPAATRPRPRRPPARRVSRSTSRGRCRQNRLSSAGSGSRCTWIGSRGASRSRRSAVGGAPRGACAADRHRRRLPARRCARRLPAARRHRGARPRGAAGAGRYNICYVNGFQTQPRREARSGSKHRRWSCATRTASRSSTRPGASCCSTSAPGTSGSGWRGSSAAGSTAARTTVRRRRVRQPRLVHPQPRAARRAGTRCAYARLLARGAHRAGPRGGAEEPRRLRRPPGRLRLRGRRGVRALRRVRRLRRRLRRPGADDRVPSPTTSTRPCGAYAATHAVVLRDRDLSPEGVHQWC